MLPAGRLPAVVFGLWSFQLPAALEFLSFDFVSLSINLGGLTAFPDKSPVTVSSFLIIEISERKGSQTSGDINKTQAVISSVLCRDKIYSSRFTTIDIGRKSGN